MLAIATTKHIYILIFILFLAEIGAHVAVSSDWARTGLLKFYEFCCASWEIWGWWLSWGKRTSLSGSLLIYWGHHCWFWFRLLLWIKCVEISLVVHLIKLVISSPTQKYDPWLTQSTKHVIERRTRPLLHQIRQNNFLRLFIQYLNRLHFELRNRDTDATGQSIEVLLVGIVEYYFSLTWGLAKQVTFAIEGAWVLLFTLLFV